MSIRDLQSKCRISGCNHNAVGATGQCRIHWRRVTDKTSDGVRVSHRNKLTAEQITEARRMRAAFMTNREIARHFGIDVNTLRVYFKASTPPPSKPQPKGERS